MALRREVVLHFRPSTEHPNAPRAFAPWIAIPQTHNRSVLYVDKERQQVVLAELDAPPAEDLLLPSGRDHALGRGRYARELVDANAAGWAQVM
jgi:hypothetical protein